MREFFSNILLWLCERVFRVERKQPPVFVPEVKNDELSNVWFISDLHIGHKNIIRHQAARKKIMGLKDEDDVETHDKYILDMWNRTVKRGDVVYILGDLIMMNKEQTRKVLHKMKANGVKIHLVVGNHDKSSQKLPEMFESMEQIKVVDFKKSVYPFLDEDFPVVMCHYPMTTWPRKANGALHLFGHVHQNAPFINFGVTEGDLMLNVGFDAPFANYGLINLTTVYKWYKHKTSGNKPKQYIDLFSAINPNFVR